MKKLIAIICMAAVMVGSAFAVDSPTKVDVTTDGKIYANADCTEEKQLPEGVTLKLEGLDGEQIDLTKTEFGNDLNDAAKLKIFFQDESISGNIVAYRFDVTIDPASKSEEIFALLNFWLKFTLPSSFNPDKDKVIGVAHYSKYYTPAKWESLNFKANGQSVAAEFTTTGKLSPVVIFVQKDAKSEGNQGGNQGGDGGKVAPKTGEPAVLAIVSVIALAAFAGMVVTKRKEN